MRDESVEILFLRIQAVTGISMKTKKGILKKIMRITMIIITLGTETGPTRH